MGIEGAQDSRVEARLVRDFGHAGTRGRYSRHPRGGTWPWARPWRDGGRHQVVTKPSLSFDRAPISDQLVRVPCVYVLISAGPGCRGMCDRSASYHGNSYYYTARTTCIAMRSRGINYNSADTPCTHNNRSRPHSNRLLDTVPAEAREHVHVHDEDPEVGYSSGTSREITNILEAGIKIIAGGTVRTVRSRCSANRTRAPTTPPPLPPLPPTHTT